MRGENRGRWHALALLMFAACGRDGSSGSSDRTAPTIAAHPPGGAYTTVQYVVLESDEPATIYYSMDGADPAPGAFNTSSADSPLFWIRMGPGTTTLKFLATDAAGNRGPVRSERYVIVPTVSRTSPLDGAAAVPRNATLTVSFREAMDPASLDASTFTLNDSQGGSVPGSVAYDASNAVATFVPSGNLSPSTTYLAELTTAVKDWSGHPLAATFTWSFTTAAAPGWQPVSTTNAPPAREGHTAVWTGKEMMVWGGFDGTYLAAGSRYDPVDDTWRPTSTVGAPGARSGHTAIWTGTETIVWGGFDGNTFATGSRYDPRTDTWRPISAVGAPTGRQLHTAVWTGTEMIVWGGLESTYLATGGRYDPGTDTWRPISTVGAPAGRSWHTAVWTGTEMIVWGGFDGTYLATGSRYDPATDTWSPISTVGAPSGRQLHTAVWTGTEMIVWGGYRYDVGDVFLQDGARYDPRTDAWRPISTVGAPTGRSWHTAVWTGTEMIAWGGYSTPSGGSPYLDSGGRYDPWTDAWQPISTAGAPSGRSEYPAVWTGAEMIVWGGYGFNWLSTGGRYAP